MILVTGGTGFIGSHLVEHLIGIGKKVRILTRNYDLPVRLKPFEQDIELVLGDITDVITIKKALKGVEYVVHLAWTTVPKNATENPVFDVQSNVIGTLHLLDQCLVEKVKKVIFISSGGTVYGTPKQIPIPESHDLMPISAYGISKVMVERYIQLYHHLHGLDYTIFRVANAFGDGQNIKSGQGVIGIWLDKAKKGEALEVWGDGSDTRDYIHVKDIAKAITASIIQENKEEKIFNLGSGEGHSLNEIAQIVQKKVNHQLEVNHFEHRGFDVSHNVLDISKIKEVYQWKPEISLSDVDTW